MTILLSDDSAADAKAATLEEGAAANPAPPKRPKPEPLRRRFQHRKAVEEYCLWTMFLYTGLGSIFLVCMVIAYVEGWGLLDGIYFGAVLLLLFAALSILFYLNAKI
jgi:hypothetical protein